MVVRTEFFEAQTDIASGLKPRIGVPPRTSAVLPHLQLDQLSTPEVEVELIQRSLALPCVSSRQSRMANPNCLALFLPDTCAAGPPDAFIDGHEFCHLHPWPESSIHLTLPRDWRKLALEFGWAEPHLVTRIGCMPQTLVLVYAPRSLAELPAVLCLVRQSYEFARGL
jgi:hypothetical protein